VHGNGEQLPPDRKAPNVHCDDVVTVHCKVKLLQHAPVATHGFGVHDSPLVHSPGEVQLACVTNVQVPLVQHVPVG